MAHREPARYVAPVHLQDPNIRTTELGAGDRAIEEARRAMLDPLGLGPGVKPKAPPQAAPNALSALSRSRLVSMYAAEQAKAREAAAVRATVAQKQATLGVIVPHVSEADRAEYARLQAENEAYDRPAEQQGK